MLGASVTSPGGIILDKNSNLIADDQGGSIDLIKPPYASAKILVSGLSDPLHASLNAKEDLLFNANAASWTVTIHTYPAMKLRKTITTSDGINAAEGVAESPTRPSNPKARFIMGYFLRFVRSLDFEGRLLRM